MKPTGELPSRESRRVALARGLVGGILLILPFIGWRGETFPTERWVWLEPAPLRTGTGESTMALDLRRSGFSGVALAGFADGRPTYASRLFPREVNDAEWKQQLEAARSEGLKVALYLQIFIHGGDPKEATHPARKFPDWVSYKAEGDNLEVGLPSSSQAESESDGVFLDPGIPRCQEYLLAMVAEALEEFRPDWLILDHLRYPLPEPVNLGTGGWSQPYGFHPAARSRFQEQSKADPLTLFSSDRSPTENADLRQAWVDWRRDRITEFLRSVHHYMDQNYPESSLAVVGYPDPFLAREVGMQDWAGWIESDLTDAVILPENGDRRMTLGRVKLLPGPLREKVWMSGSIPASAPDPRQVAQDLSAGSGLLVFDSNRIIEDFSPETLRAMWMPDELPQEVAPVSLVETRGPKPEATEATPATGTDQHPLPTFDREIRALYGFSPNQPPFAGMTPNQIVEKLTSFGFNAVFGGSDSDPLRRALVLGNILRFEEVPLFVGKSHWEKHPESQPVAKNGRALKQQSWYAPVCPNQPWLRAEKLERILTHVVSRELDGVWLDFIRYPVFWEEVPPFLPETCFCPVCLQSFWNRTGIQAIGGEPQEEAQFILDNHAEEWYRWRADSLLEYIETVRNEVKQRSPKTLVGAFVLPWTESENDRALYRIAGQDLKGFGERLDVLSPMLYFHELHKPTSWIGDRIASLATELACPVLPIVQCYDQPTPLPPESLKEALERGRSGASQGVILFSQRHLESGSKWNLIGASLTTPKP